MHLWRGQQQIGRVDLKCVSLVHRKYSSELFASALGSFTALAAGNALNLRFIFLHRVLLLQSSPVGAVEYVLRGM